MSAIVSFQRGWFVAPDPELMPEPVRPLLEELQKARENWRLASARAHDARVAVAKTPSEFAAAVIAAAREGKDAGTVTDPLPELTRAAEAASIAERAMHDECVGVWWRLWQAVAENFEEAVEVTEKPVVAASERLAKLEAQTAKARSDLAAALAVRSWVSTRRVMASADYIGVNRGGPSWRTEATTRSLDELHAAEEKARAAEQHKAEAEALVRQRQQETEERYAQRREQQAARREQQAARRAVKTGPVPFRL